MQFFMVAKAENKTVCMDMEGGKGTTHPVSLMLCILSCAFPISIVLAPNAALSIGPIVLPHEESFLTTNNCSGTFAPLATS